MTEQVTTLPAAPAAYALDVPEGWAATHRPGADIELHVQAPDLDGLATGLTLERFSIDEQTPPDAIDGLLSGRIEALLTTTVTPLLIDVAAADRPKGAIGPGIRATIAYRHGPATVTSLLWAFRSESEAFLLTGVVDTDLLERDRPQLEGIVASLDLGATTDDDELPPLEPEPGQEPVGPLADPPAGWRDADVGDDRRLRRLLVPAVDPAASVVSGVSVATMLVPSQPGDDSAHELALLDLAQTLTDATLLGTEPSTLAGRSAQRSSIWFRSATGDQIAEVWTAAAVVVWSITAAADEDGRTLAAALVADASLAELGCAEGRP